MTEKLKLPAIEMANIPQADTAWGLWHNDGTGGWLGSTRDGPWLFTERRTAEQARIEVQQALDMEVEVKPYGDDPGDADLYFGGMLEEQ